MFGVSITLLAQQQIQIHRYHQIAPPHNQQRCQPGLTLTCMVGVCSGQGQIGTSAFRCSHAPKPALRRHRPARNPSVPAAASADVRGAHRHLALVKVIHLAPLRSMQSTSEELACSQIIFHPGTHTWRQYGLSCMTAFISLAPITKQLDVSCSLLGRPGPPPPSISLHCRRCKFLFKIHHDALSPLIVSVPAPADICST